jgi:hypothetical protein
MARKLAKIIGWSIIGMVLVWGTFWTIVVFNFKYHVFNLFPRQAVTLAKERDIPNFDLGNYQTNEQRNSSVVYSPGNWSRIFPPKQAYDKVWSLNEVQQLFRQTLSQGSMPASKVALIWNPKDSSLFWQVEFVDRVCDCKGLRTNALNLAEVRLNPIDKQIVSLTIIEALSEKEFIKLQNNIPDQEKSEKERR